MDSYYLNGIIKVFMLKQRSINSEFRKATGINRTHLEILTFADTVTCFNPYQVQVNYPEMNLQQVRLGIRKLSSLGDIELIRGGIKNMPAVYMIAGRKLKPDNHALSGFSY